MTARPPRFRPRTAGFTLIEILVVLVIIGLLFGLVGGSIYRSLDSVKVRRVGSEVVNALRHTRARAIVEREEKMLEVDVEKRVYTAPNREAEQLPDGVDITIRTASMDILSDTRGRIRFYPDGSSTGGTVTLMAGDKVWRVDVAWLTGEITLETSQETG